MIKPFQTDSAGCAPRRFGRCALRRTRSANGYAHLNEWLDLATPNWLAFLNRDPHLANMSINVPVTRVTCFQITQT